MKRFILLALILVVSASFFSVMAQKKSKKATASKQTPAYVVLTNGSDSASYAAGMALTEGLTAYLKQQYGIDEAFMDDFLRGLEETVNSGIDESTKAYGAGMLIAHMVKERMLPDMQKSFAEISDSIQSPLFYKGFVAALKKDTSSITLDAANQVFKARMEKIEAKKQAEKAAQDREKALRNEANRKAGEQFLAENKLKDGVKTTASGLQYKVITQGTGAIPKAEDEVIVKYEGRLIDGTVFDSSYKRADPTNKFRANQLIKGWTEALTLMPVGSKWELYIPQELAYGSRDMGQIPPYSTLIFTLELVDIAK